MGEVYKARDARLERTVAVKILPEHLAGSSELHERFEREAKLISSLSHPHICTLHDVGREGSVDFLVMEFLEGETLADRLRRGPVPLAEALAIGRDLADALDAAHRHGVVHRDLKPGNIMLTKSGVQLLDFGLAKQQAGVGTGSLSGVSALPTEAKPLTEKGSMLGTFQYMAPEQLEGKEVSPRTDIFALGSILYEMVTGRRAFEGGSPASLIGAIMSSEPAAPSTLQSMSPPALDHVVETCLAKNPDDRWQSAADVKRELEWIAKERSSSPVGPTVVARRTPRWTLAVAVLLSALTGALLSLLARPTPEMERPVTKFALGSEMNVSGGFAFSSDGQRLVYSSIRDGRPQLFQRAMDEVRGAPIEGTENGRSPFFSPDGEWIAYDQAGGSLDISVWRDEEVEPLIGSGFYEGGPNFSPDGRFVAFTSNETGRNEVYVTEHPEAKRKWPISTDGGAEPMWSRDSRELFFRQGGRMMSVDVVMEQTFSAGEERVLFEGSFVPGGFAGNANYDVSPDGKRFLMVRQDETVAGQVYVILNWFEELKRVVPLDE